MPMGSIERKNIWEWYQIRKEENRESFFVILCILIVPVLGEIISYISILCGVSNDTYMEFQTYSTNAFFIGILYCVTLMWNYKRTLSRHEIFPHTKRSVFLSDALHMCASMIKLQIIALGIYIFFYVLNLIVGKVSGSIILIYQFNAFGLLAGFWVTLCYSFLVASFVLLIGALDRKFHWYFRSAAATCICMMVISYRNDIKELLKRFLGFWTNETSVLIFSVKAIITFVILLLLAYIIDQKTIKRPVGKIRTSESAMFTVNIIFIMVIIFSGVLLWCILPSESTGTVEEEKAMEVMEPFEKSLDISSLGAKKLKIICNKKLKGKAEVKYYEEENFLEEEVEEGVLVCFGKERYIINGINLEEYPYYVMDAELEGDNLKITYENKAINVFLSPSSFMKPFTYFQGKQYYKNSSYSESYYNGRVEVPEGNCIVYLPKGISYTIEFEEWKNLEKVT